MNLPSTPQPPNELVNASGPSTSPPSRTDSAELELACVDLICKLEHDLAHAKEGYRGDHVDESAATSRRMLTCLVEFTQAHLPTRETPVINAVTIAIEAARVHENVIQSRSWTLNLASVFVNVVEDKAAQSHAELGKAMSVACNTVFKAAVEELGPNSPIGEQVQQSLEVFDAEFTRDW